MKLSKGIIVTLVIVGVLVIIFLWGMGGYNNMVSQEEGVTSAWSQVENVYQRRADLIPNLVATVKGYAAHEQETLEGVVNARAKATQTTIDPANMTPEAMAQFQAAQGELSTALGKLMVVVERYPDLKANQNFMDLQSQLQRIEDEIANSRKYYNAVVKEFNTKVESFPSNIIAGIFKFTRKTMFEVSDEAQREAVKVQF